MVICSLASACYAQPRSVERESAPTPSTEEKNSCPVVQEALSEEIFLDDDFFFDMEDDRECAETLPCDEPEGVISRLQELVNKLGVQAILGAMYISGVCSDTYNYVQGLLYEKK